jgi:glutamyl-tRNA synthetase
MTWMTSAQSYRGRLAPSPTGYLHVGHARTFWIAYQRARAAGGVLALSNEDLDPQRSKPEYLRAFIEDLHWFGISWQEGPSGPYAPYSQSERRDVYLQTWRKLHDGGWIYPCTCSRKDLAEAAQAPHESNDEPMYSGKCRGRKLQADSPAGVNWRFRAGWTRALVPRWRTGRAAVHGGGGLRRLRGVAAR